VLDLRLVEAHFVGKARVAARVLCQRRVGGREVRVIVPAPKVLRPQRRIIAAIEYGEAIPVSGHAVDGLAGEVSISDPNVLVGAWPMGDHHMGRHAVFISDDARSRCDHVGVFARLRDQVTEGLGVDST